jgi:hypothetical protein
MVNLTVSNDKLFSRAISIVASITSTKAAAAQHALLRSLYDRDGSTDDLQQLPVAQHVARGAAKQGQRAVPVAIMLAMDDGLSVAQVTWRVTVVCGVLRGHLTPFLYTTPYSFPLHNALLLSFTQRLTPFVYTTPHPFPLHNASPLSLRLSAPCRPNLACARPSRRR